MSRQRQDPVDAAFERIVQLTPEQYARLEERLKGWQYTDLAPAQRKRERERLKKSQEVAQA